MVHQLIEVLEEDGGSIPIEIFSHSVKNEVSSVMCGLVSEILNKLFSFSEQVEVFGFRVVYDWFIGLASIKIESGRRSVLEVVHM